MSKILLLNGPNLNLLGTREPEIYGHQTLEQIVADATRYAQSLGHEIVDFQSNGEQALVERLHMATNEAVRFIIINPGALTHTSIVLRDAFLGVDIPFIELHISNVFAREEFRQVSFLSDIAVGVISGLGTLGYQLAIDSAHQHLSKSA